MPAYIAMLRGINVGQNKIIKMERLRASFEDLGLSKVKTYVQSGNVVFEAERTAAAELSGRIEDRILRDFGFAVPVFVKTWQEMKDIISRNPFVREKEIDRSKLHVTFLSEAPAAAAVKNLGALAAKSERFRVLNQEVYLYCPDGYGKTKLSNNSIERKLSVIATTRNWKTVNALLEMSA